MTHRIPRPVVSLAALSAVASLVPDAALAQSTFADGPPYSIDIEFLRPAFGHDGFAGVDVPRTNRNLTLRYGTVLQYEAAPLTLYEAVEHQELGTVVSNRFSGLFGLSLDVQRVTFSVLLPTAFNWGSEAQQEAFAADGFGVGDASASARIVLLQTPRDVFNLGIRGGLLLPTGKQLAYIGEGELRFQVGALAALNLGQFTLATDFGVMTRPIKTTTEDFVASSEVVWGNGLRYKLPDATRTGVSGQVLTRAGTEAFLKGGAENAVEALAGLEFYPSRRATITLGGGRGLTEGYGTTDFRILGGLLIEIPPPEPLPPTYVAEAPPPPPEEPPPIDVLVEEPPPAVVFEEGELAVQVMDRIYIKDMIEFIVDTNILQEYSKPTLVAVADIINKNPQIAHLIIEGHASQEGSHDHNYELAESRARRVWEVLMENGVAKERISYRGMGEVVPIKEGTDEETLQVNRRVEFLIVDQYEGVDEMPDYPDFQTLPWDGRIVPVIKPPKPEPPPEPTGPKLDEFGMPIDEDEELDTGVPAPAPQE